MKKKKKPTLDPNDLTPEWQALKDLTEGEGLKLVDDPQTDGLFNQKIHWFLEGGAAGVLILIKEVFGEDGLKQFYEFLDYYLSSPDGDGHYHYSNTIKTKIKNTGLEMLGVEFADYIKGLKKELIEIDRQKHGQEG